MNSITGRWPLSPSCSGGCALRPRGSVSSGASSWPFQATMGLPAIILSHGLPCACAQTNQDREEEGRRGDDHRRRVERKFDGLRKAENREGEDDRRHADEEDDERQQPNRRREGPSRVPAPVGEPIELREGSGRQGGEGWHHRQDREDRERREIESAKEPEGGAEREAEEDLRRGARPAGEVRLDREENPDHREGECRARPNRQRREDEGHERGRRRGPPRLSSVQPSLQWTVDSGGGDAEEDGWIRPEVLGEGLPQREHEEGEDRKSVG